MKITETQYDTKKSNLVVTCLCCGKLVRFSRLSKRKQEFIAGMDEMKKRLEITHKDCDTDLISEVSRLYYVTCQNCGSKVYTKLAPAPSFFEHSNDDLDREAFFDTVFYDRAREMNFRDFNNLLHLRPLYIDEYVEKAIRCKRCGTKYEFSSKEEKVSGRVRYVFCPGCGKIQPTQGCRLLEGKIPHFFDNTIYAVKMKEEKKEDPAV